MNYFYKLCVKGSMGSTLILISISCTIQWFLFLFILPVFLCQTDRIVRMWNHVCVYVMMRMVVEPSFNLSYAIFDYCVATFSCCAQTAFSHCPWWIPSLKWRYNIHSVIIMVEDTFYGNFTDYDIFSYLLLCALMIRM